jgi:hypothetical protein
MAAKLVCALGACLCLVVAAAGVFVCAVEVEALVTGANVPAWGCSLILLVLLPLAGCVLCTENLIKFWAQRE